MIGHDLKRILQLLLMTIAGCAGLACAHGAVRPEPRTADANTKVVSVVWPSERTAPMSPEAWRASPWWREDDVVTPSRVVISSDRYACIMRDGDTRDPRPMHAFTCADQWRYPRARGPS